MNKYWENRLKLLSAIQDKGYNTPISNICADIFALGSSLSNIINELEDNGLIIKVKGTFISTFLTVRGEKALNLLIELKKVWCKNE